MWGREGKLPMVRLVRVFFVIAALSVGSVLGVPSAALAATTVTAVTPLLAEPTAGAATVSVLPVGTDLAIQGAPRDGFYPVLAGGVSGWVDGAALAVDKQAAPAALAATAAPPAAPPPPTVPAAPSPPAEVATSDASGTDGSATGPVGGAEQSPAAGVAAELPRDSVATATPTPATDTASEAAPSAAADPALGADPADSAEAPAVSGDAAPPASTSPATATMASADPSPTASASPTPVPETVPATATATDDTATATVTATTATVAPAWTEPAAAPASETLPPTATPEPTPKRETRTGPATAKWNSPLREWPGEGSPIVFTVPAGATVEQLGDVSDGHVYATYMWMWGWIPIEALGPAAPVAEEVVSKNVEEEEVRTPRPGAGEARTTVDMSLRAGPSASERAIASVPAGSKVEQTGVMENGFQRVVWDGQIGWIANDYLELPATPTPETGNGRPNGNPEYSEQEIIRIIHAAADRYGQDREDMLRVARCESNLDPYAVNPSGSYGLFQFIRSTWESTPYGGEDIFDPRANAMAAGWMWAEGRRSEWVCK